MIQLPRRSVTRFFIPLVDVMMLMFCIFLLMPMVKPNPEASPLAHAASLEEQLIQKQRELDKRQKEGPELAKLAEELKRLQEAKAKELQQRLLIRVLEIDAATGKLFYSDPEPIELRSLDDARDLIERDRRSQGASRREVYYLIQFPRTGKGPPSIHPTRKEREEYGKWFAGVPLGWDIPGEGPARGAVP